MPSLTAIPVWAAFDFDGTLTSRDSLLPFLQYLIGKPRLWVILLQQSPWLAAYAIGLYANDKAKQRLLKHCIAGMTRQHLQQQAAAYAHHIIPSLIRPHMLQRLQQHQALGHTCVLVTASLTLYTQVWAHQVGFQHAIGTELEFNSNNQATGALQGRNCFGVEKANRLKKIMPLHAQLYAYGDSRGDQEMLAMANFASFIQRHNQYGASLPQLEARQE